METKKRMELAKVIIEEVRPVLQDSKSKKVDYGSGTVLISLELSDLVDSILLVDSSKQVLQDATDKLLEKALLTLRYLVQISPKTLLNLRRTSYYCL